ncbi:MAG TPA: hypothetical protein HPP77_10805, partial [Candidatus Hydrogenedentes bacterium]|nr:hypothetical protein [Candidatus Hydrogenedentota bacterium]
TYRPSRSVAKAVGQGAAVLVSEFPPDAPWETHAAVTRNAVISALARLVCVIEPRKTGGSIRTARIALNQGKSVLVHVGWAAAARLDGLFAAGAMPLVPKGATFNAQRLLTVWRDAAALTNHRVDLFEPRA